MGENTSLPPWDAAGEWSPPPSPPRSGVPRWLIIGGAAVALALTLCLGVLIGSATQNSFAASAAPGQSHARWGTVPGNGTNAGLPGHGHGPGMGRGGLTVTAVGASTITAKRGDGTSVTIQTNSSTQYLRAGKTVARSAIANGQALHVEGTRNSDGSIAATRIQIVLPSLGGTVTAVSGGDITVQDPKSASATHVIHTTGATTFTRAGATATISAVTVGERIHAMGTLRSDGSLDAEAVQVQLPHADGKITQINGSTITVQDRDGTLTIHVSGTTKYFTVTKGASGPVQSAAALGDLKAGAFISAEGTKNSDGSLNAETVRILPAGAFDHGHGHGHAHGGPPPSGTSATSSSY
jgi:hypothetical protein